MEKPAGLRRVHEKNDKPGACDDPQQLPRNRLILTGIGMIFAFEFGGASAPI
jgi:hypothetical protein